MLAATYGLQVSDIPVLFDIKLKLFPGGHLHPEAGVHACWMDGRLHPIVRQLLILHKAVHLTDCLTDSLSTAFSCPYTHSGAWTTSVGEIPVWSLERVATRRSS